MRNIKIVPPVSPPECSVNKARAPLRELKSLPVFAPVISSLPSLLSCLAVPVVGGGAEGLPTQPEDGADCGVV